MEIKNTLKSIKGGKMEEAKIISKEVKEEPKVENKDRYTIGEVITGTAPVISFEGNALTEQQALVTILNKLDKIEKNLLG